MCAYKAGRTARAASNLYMYIQLRIQHHAYNIIRGRAEEYTIDACELMFQAGVKGMSEQSELIPIRFKLKLIANLLLLGG